MVLNTVALSSVTVIFGVKSVNEWLLSNFIDYAKLLSTFGEREVIASHCKVDLER